MLVFAAPGDETEVPRAVEDRTALADICRGQWYWITDEPDEPEEGEEPIIKPPWLGCVTHVGSNYAELRSPHASSQRIHFTAFDQRCSREPNALAHIDQQIVEHQKETLRLMGQVRELTTRLAISPERTLSQEASTAALVLRASSQPVDAYKKDLVLAKEKTLPDLFSAIKESNGQVKTWMKARLIPTKAEVAELAESVGGIEERIFHVELYAGLVESVVQIRKGKPAADSEKIRLMQRRAYMDEECLANYEAGGMTFKNLKAFDRWMARPENFQRILPFPRCVIALQVRRHGASREGFSIHDFFRIIEEEGLDKLTFLYLRNGAALYRLKTAIDFGAKLFPDMDRRKLDGKLWAKIHGEDTVEKLLTEGQYEQLLEDERKEEEEEAKSEAELPTDMRRPRRYRRLSSYFDQYVFFSPETVYHDDITAYVQKQVKEHNRLVLVLQGLLDRSPVFLPHPPWSLWTEDGFTNALELIYDDDRALSAGDKPDFEAYRAKLNASIRAGSVTVGQEDFWERVEARKENERRGRRRRWKGGEYNLDHYSPPGNPGPGLIAQVVRHLRTKACIYEWHRPRARDSWRGADAEPRYLCKLKVPASKVFHIDAYTPGDFRQFFNDPRTRAEYLRWAPLLLVAEDYHAGKRKIK